MYLYASSGQSMAAGTSCSLRKFRNSSRCPGANPHIFGTKPRHPDPEQTAQFVLVADLLGGPNVTRSVSQARGLDGLETSGP